MFDIPNIYFNNITEILPTYVLCLVHMLNTLPLCLTAAAGTELARDFLFDISTWTWLRARLPDRVALRNILEPWFIMLNLRFSGNSPKRNMGYDNLPSQEWRDIFIPYLTQKCMIRLSPIVKYSSLLPLICGWALFQSHCGLYPGQEDYGSLAWDSVQSQLPNPNRIFLYGLHMKNRVGFTL